MDGGAETILSTMPESLKRPAGSSSGRITPRGRRSATASEANIMNVSDYDPVTGLEVFKSHWKMALNIMDQKGSSYSTDDVKTAVNHLKQMTSLLCEEASGSRKETTNGPLLDFFLMEEVLYRFHLWSLQSMEHVDDLKFDQLKIYEELLTTGSMSVAAKKRKHLLAHEPILNPLLSLLNSCAECHSKTVENALIDLLHLLCISISSNPTLLESLFSAAVRKSAEERLGIEYSNSFVSSDTRDSLNESFLIFSLLIPYTHKEGHLGQTARDALLLIMSLSSRHPKIGSYIASEEHSNFCIVLATGLSGLYSSLPRKLSPILGTSPDQWCHLSKEDTHQIPDLLQFLNSLEFCNAVTQAAHPTVKQKLLEFVYHGFLVPVIGPALHQNSLEEVATATAYLDLFLRTITEPSLMSTFLRFILTEKHDEIVILDSLITRINSNSKLCAVSLSLFKTVLDLNCEDAMLQLVLKHLLPLDHVMTSQRYRATSTGKGASAEIEIYLQAAPEKFLSMIPSCCVFDEDQSTSGSNELSRDSGLDHSTPNQFQAARSNRRGSFSSMASTDIFAAANQPPRIPQELSYLQYLQDARCSLASCASASACWSSGYDASDSSSAPACINPETAPSEKRKLKTVAPLPPRTDDFKIPEFKIQRLPTKTIELDVDNASGSPDKKRKREEKNDSGIDGLSIDPSASTCSDVSPCDSASNEDPEILATHKAASCEPGMAPISRSASIPSVLERAQTPTNIFDISIEDTMNELDALFDHIDDVSKRNESALREAQRDDSDANIDGPLEEDVEEDEEEEEELVEEEEEEVEDAEAKLSDGCEDPLAQFLDLSCEGATDALEKIQRNSSINDPVTMELSYGKLKSEAENTKPSRSSSSLFFDDSSISSPSTSYHDLVSIEGSAPANLGENTIGPFLQALLLKLEGMLHNSYSVNLLLTGVIIRLAAYPQPIIRSFLLHPSLVFQPNVKSLMQVLNTLKQKLDHFSYSVDNFEDLLGKSKKFLRLRELESGIQSATGRKLVPSLRHPRATSSSPTSTTITQKITPEKESSRFRGLADLFRSASSKKVNKDQKRTQIQLQMQQRRHLEAQEQLQATQDGRGFRFFSQPNSISTAQTLDDDPIFNEMTRAEATKLKNAVFSAIVLEEFLKELAAMAQEHALFMMMGMEQ